VRLGILDIDEVLGLTAKKFIGWEHYAALEPFDETRSDYRAASIATMIANVNRGKDQRAYTLDDFVLKFGQQKKKQSPDDQLLIAKMFAAAFGASEQDLANMRPEVVQ
jgi:hypothetical protein